MHQNDRLGVEAGEIETFPLLYHYRIVPFAGSGAQLLRSILSAISAMSSTGPAIRTSQHTCG